MDILIAYSGDAAEATRTLIDSYGLSGRIGDKDTAIVLKPNFVTPSDAESGATTHIGIIETLVQYLQGNGFTDITVAEGSWVGALTAEAFSSLGLDRLARNYGIRLIDLKRDRFRRVSYGGFDMEVSETILSAGYLINLPVLKGHCQTRMTCCMKNLKGCLSDRSKREFHNRGLSKPIAALNAIVKPDLNIVDSICGDLDFEEGGNPVRTDRMFLGEDAVLMDAFSAGLMGFAPEEIGYLAAAAAYGIGSLDLSQVHLKELSKPCASSARPTGMAARLARYTAPDMACSACYASLIHALKRMEDNGTIGRLGGRKVACGQGYRGKSPEIGCGACCRGAGISVKGCPPTASDILAMLESL